MSRTEHEVRDSAGRGASAFIQTARDLAVQDGVRMYVSRDAHGAFYVSSSKRQAVWVVHTDGHVSTV